MSTATISFRCRKTWWEFSTQETGKEGAGLKPDIIEVMVESKGEIVT